MKPTERIFVALDTPDLEKAVALARSLKGLVGGMKVGKEFFTSLGPRGVQAISDEGMPVFLDLKFHDIPNTVASALRAALPLSPFMINVHASGGAAMMTAAANALKEATPKPVLLGVTVLTSMSEEDLTGIGLDVAVPDQVRRLALLAKDSGLDGVVCSAKEVEMLREACGPDFKLVVPGIRPVWAASDDQKRIVTPKNAVDMGADYLVIGRPITGAEDPVKAARLIAEELNG